MTAAYLLVSHGSRDLRSQIAFQQLAELVRQQLRGGSGSSWSKDCHQLAKRKQWSPGIFSSGQLPCPPVGTASVECTPVPLSQQIQQFARQVREAGWGHLQIVPLLLLPGVHVLEDIPREVALARQVLGDSIHLELRPPLGTHPSLSRMLEQQFNQLPAQGRIILSHGSRRPGGNCPVEIMACQLDALAAYWSVSPNLTETVTVLARQGQESIAIVPYFLFAGGIMEGIAQQVEQLETTFAQLRLLLGQPLGATPELVRSIIDQFSENFSDI